MDLVAVHCRRCSCFYLENEVGVVAGNAVCECGGLARALPELRYTRADESLFDAIVTSLEVAGVSWVTAPDLSRALDGCEHLPEGAALSALARSWPALQVIELIVSGSPERARHAEAVLQSLLQAILATRTRSGFVPRFGAISSDKTGR